MVCLDFVEDRSLLCPQAVVISSVLVDVLGLTVEAAHARVEVF